MHPLIKFRQYLVGNKFVVKTDHNSLRYFLTQKDLNERQKKWVSSIQAFDFDIEYVKGKNNVVVNALSRRPSISLMDVAENWKSTLQVGYAKDNFIVKCFMGITMMIGIRCWKELSTTNIESIWSLIQV